MVTLGQLKKKSDKEQPHFVLPVAVQFSEVFMISLGSLGAILRSVNKQKGKNMERKRESATKQEQLYNVIKLY